MKDLCCENAVKVLPAHGVSLNTTLKSNEKLLLKFSLNFPLGTKSQIIPTAVRTNVQMELRNAWPRSHGISLSERAASRSSLHHVLSVSEKMINFVAPERKLWNRCQELRN